VQQTLPPHTPPQAIKLSPQPHNPELDQPKKKDPDPPNKKGPP
jgi:hypothetical protein